MGRFHENISILRCSATACVTPQTAPLLSLRKTCRWSREFVTIIVSAGFYRLGAAGDGVVSDRWIEAGKEALWSLVIAERSHREPIGLQQVGTSIQVGPSPG